MHRFFTWLFGGTTVREHDNDALLALTKQIVHLGTQLEALSDRHERLRVDFIAFRGRVYAWKGKELPAETPQEAPEQLPLNDPRLTKEQLRARLLKPGKPFKHN